MYIYIPLFILKYYTTYYNNLNIVQMIAYN